MTQSRNILTACLAVTFGVTTLAAGTYLWWRATPPPIPTTLDEAVETLASPRYQRLTEDEKQPYLEQTHRLSEPLSMEQRREIWQKAGEDPEKQKAMREAGGDMMMLRAKEFATADEAKRIQILDQTIAMMEMGQRMRLGGGGGAGRGDRPDRGNRDDSQLSDEERAKRREQRMAERRRGMQQRIERGNPQRQAYVSEFFKALQKRRDELGLPRNGPSRRD